MEEMMRKERSTFRGPGFDTVPSQRCRSSCAASGRPLCLTVNKRQNTQREREREGRNGEKQKWRAYGGRSNSASRTRRGAEGRTCSGRWPGTTASIWIRPVEAREQMQRERDRERMRECMRQYIMRVERICTSARTWKRRHVCEAASASNGYIS
jgi:hypothetical protein